MAYDFSTRMDLLGTRMKQLHQNTLTYTRGATVKTITNFTPEQIKVESLAEFGLVNLKQKYQDFVFDTADLSGLDEPLSNDQIVWDGNTYQVCVLGDETFRFTTSSRLRIRVHTVQVA